MSCWLVVAAVIDLDVPDQLVVDVDVGVVVIDDHCRVDAGVDDSEADGEPRVDSDDAGRVRSCGSHHRPREHGVIEGLVSRA